MKRRLVALTLLLFVAPRAHAGPWPVGRGHLYTKASTQYLRSTTLAAPDGTDFEIPPFFMNYIDLYGAVGATDRLSVTVTIPVLRSTDLLDNPDELRRESGFGDLRLGLQAQLGKSGPWVFAARGIGQAPTGDAARSEGLQATGSGVWEGEGWIGAGRSLSGGKGYAFAEVGYNYRGGGFQDGFLYTVQLGWNVNRRLVLAANLRGLEPFRSGTVTAGSLAGFGNAVTYSVYGPTAIVNLGGGFGLQIDVEGAFNTKNLATGTVFRGGISFAR